MNYPRDLAKLTPEQIQSCMDYYLSLSEKKLRRKQLIVSDQLANVAHAGSDRVGVRNLRIQMALMTVAVDRKAFPEGQPENVLEQAMDALWYATDEFMGKPYDPNATTVVNG